VSRIGSQTRGLARPSAALSSLAHSAHARNNLARGTPMASALSSALQLRAPEPAHLDL
jgi:hypothetical protein